jgi:hypothetical protein
VAAKSRSAPVADSNGSPDVVVIHPAWPWLSKKQAMALLGIRETKFNKLDKAGEFGRKSRTSEYQTHGDWLWHIDGLLAYQDRQPKSSKDLKGLKPGTPKAQKKGRR